MDDFAPGPLPISDPSLPTHPNFQLMKCSEDNALYPLKSLMLRFSMDAGNPRCCCCWNAIFPVQPVFGSKMCATPSCIDPRLSPSCCQMIVRSRHRPGLRATPNSRRSNDPVQTDIVSMCCPNMSDAPERIRGTNICDFISNTIRPALS